ncbi:MAG TPA: lytic transglycosylase domain-containing protein [Burkholderiaceae bacterium]|nr:lytic transglycosylase domain-containing protein [Burkholderiaceae bacterium]
MPAIRHRFLPLPLAAAWGFALTLVAGAAAAGPQQYEPMSAAVRAALVAAVRDETPGEARFDSVIDKVEWLAAMSARLPRRWKPDHYQRMEFLEAVRYEAQRAGLDPHLVLGLIEVESGFRRYAISHAGARGYMQVMPFWTSVIGDRDPAGLFDMRANLRYGCAILRHYLDIERGNLFRALGRYNGSLGRAEYPNMVLRAWKRWEALAPAPAPTSPGESTRMLAGEPAPISPVAAATAADGR